MIKDLIHGIFIIAQVLFIFFGLYYFFISLCGLMEKSRNHKYANYLPLKKFAIFIPAHNEETVIGNLVENLQYLQYPKKYYDVFVIADNCKDGTAEKAREGGATVLIRTDNKKRGKGHALQWAFKKVLYEKNSDYDAVVIFDADNLVSKKFLNVMNNGLCEGNKALQGYIDSKNSEDSWITASYSLAFWSANRLFQCARWYLGMGCQIGGTGFCVDVETLKTVGWGADCLVEDLEFTMKLALNGIQVAWAHDAVIYDEKPLTLAQSWRQRRRWMQGFADVCSRYFKKLFIRGIKERDIAMLDCAIYTLQPYVAILGGLMLLVPVLDLYIFNSEMLILSRSYFPKLFIAYGIIQFLMIPFGLYLDDKLSYKLLYYYPVYIFYCLTWIPISIEGVMTMKNKEWNHTLHTRKLTIHELE